MRGCAILVLLFGCSAAGAAPPDEGKGGGDAAGRSAGGAGGSAVAGTGGAPGPQEAGASTGGVPPTAGVAGVGAAGSTSASGGTPTTCTQVADTEAACPGCGVDFYRCGEERAYWESESGQRFECADAAVPIPDCVAAHDAAVAWVQGCCGQ